MSTPRPKASTALLPHSHRYVSGGPLTPAVLPLAVDCLAEIGRGDARMAWRSVRLLLRARLISQPAAGCKESWIVVGPTVLTNDSACMSSQPAQAGAWHTAGLLLSHGTHRHSAGGALRRLEYLLLHFFTGSAGQVSQIRSDRIY